MAKDKKGFMLYADQKEVVNELPDDIAGQLFKHIYSYVNDENPETDNLLIKVAFAPIKHQLKRDLKKYEAICIKNTENVRKRWKSKDTTAYDRIRPITKHTDKDNDKDNDKDIKELNVQFDKFWELYDKKKDKIKSLTCWKKLNSADRKAIMDYVPRYKVSTPDKTYRKDPKTFLYNRSWENEIITSGKILPAGEFKDRDIY